MTDEESKDAFIKHVCDRYFKQMQAIAKEALYYLGSLDILLDEEEGDDEEGVGS